MAIITKEQQRKIIKIQMELSEILIREKLSNFEMKMILNELLNGFQFNSIRKSLNRNYNLEKKV
jgi:hypothetical protein